MKYSNHFWYLTEGTTVLAFFDDTLPNEIKKWMVKSLYNKPTDNSTNRLILSPNDIGEKFPEKTCLFFYLKIECHFFSPVLLDSLKEDPNK